MNIRWGVSLPWQKVKMLSLIYNPLFYLIKTLQKVLPYNACADVICEEFVKICLSPFAIVVLDCKLLKQNI